MRKQLKFTTRFAIVAVAAGGLCLAGATYGAEETAKKETPATAKTAASPGKEAMKTKDAGGSLSMKDKSFMKEAAKGGMMEVDMGRMAQEKGKSADVKKLGGRMVADHGKANTELMGIAKKKGVDLSKEKVKMAKMNDADFDKEYVNGMVKDHEKDLSAFEAEAKNGSDADVKAFASKTAEVIKKHLAMFKEAQGKMK